MTKPNRYLQLLLPLMLSLPAQAVDWSQIDSNVIGMAYPGQTPLQFILNKGSHKGAEKFRKGSKVCLDCHDDDFEDQGQTAADKYDTDPLQGARLSTEIQVQMAIEGEHLLTRISWPSDKFPASGTRLSLMLDDGSYSAFGKAGCWVSCHIDSAGMPKAKPNLPEKYLAASRTKMSMTTGGVATKPQAQLQALLDQGKFLELWQAQLQPDGSLSASSGYILDQRHPHSASAIEAQSLTTPSVTRVVFSRPLRGGEHIKPITLDNSYTFALAMHAPDTEGRHHLVSYHYSFTIRAGKVTIAPVRMTPP